MTHEVREPARRRFLADAARYGLLAAIGLVAGRLVGWQSDAAGPLHPGERCDQRGLCRGCRSLPECRSLQAELFRQGKEF